MSGVGRSIQRREREGQRESEKEGGDREDIEWEKRGRRAPHVVRVKGPPTKSSN